MGFADEYEHALRYEADDATLDHLLSPQHLDTDTLWGTHPEAELRRGVLADALSDHGREEEAGWVRDHKRPIAVADGKVVPRERGGNPLFTAVQLMNRLARNRERAEGVKPTADWTRPVIDPGTTPTSVRYRPTINTPYHLLHTDHATSRFRRDLDEHLHPEDAETVKGYLSVAEKPHHPD